MARTRTGTCTGCGKKRKLTYPPDKTKEVMHHPDGRRKLLSSAEHAEAFKKLIHYYGLCSECFPLVQTQDDIKRLRDERPVKSSAEKARMAYPIIGGPLDGEYATTADFHRAPTTYDAIRKKMVEIGPEGMYHHLQNEYIEYNCASGSGKRIGSFPPSMVFLHKGSLKPLASARER